MREIVRVVTTEVFIFDHNPIAAGAVFLHDRPEAFGCFAFTAGHQFHSQTEAVGRSLSTLAALMV